MEKRFLALWMWLCKVKFQVKLDVTIAHYRLPSASQKRAGLSSLVTRAFERIRATKENLSNLLH